MNLTSLMNYLINDPNAPKVERRASRKRGSVAQGLLLRVGESLLISFIIGGVLLFGYSQSVGVKVDNLLSSVSEIKTEMKSLTATVAADVQALATHIAVQNAKEEMSRREKKSNKQKQGE